MSGPNFNSSIGCTHGALPATDQIAIVSNWDTARTYTNAAGGIDFDSTMANYRCLQIEDIEHSETQVQVWYWDQDPAVDTAQAINFADNQYLSPRQPWIRALDYASGDATSIKCYFVRNVVSQ